MVSLIVFLFFLIVSYIVICAIAATDKSVAEAYDVSYKARFLKVLKCDINNNDNIIAICVTSFFAAIAIFGLSYCLSYKPITLRIVRKNEVSAEFEQIYSRFGVQYNKKFIVSKYYTGFSCLNESNRCFNKEYFVNMFKAGQDISEYANISLDGSYIEFKKPAIDLITKPSESNESIENEIISED